MSIYCLERYHIYDCHRPPSPSSTTAPKIPPSCSHSLPSSCYGVGPKRTICVELIVWPIPRCTFNVPKHAGILCMLHNVSPRSASQSRRTVILWAMVTTWLIINATSICKIAQSWPHLSPHQLESYGQHSGKTIELCWGLSRNWLFCFDCFRCACCCRWPGSSWCVL